MRGRRAVWLAALAAVAACEGGGLTLDWKLSVNDGTYLLATVEDIPIAEQPDFTGMQAAPVLTTRCVTSAGPERRLVSGSAEVQGENARIVFQFQEWCLVNGHRHRRASEVAYEGRLGPPAARGPREDEGDGSADDGPGVPAYSARMFSLLAPDGAELARGSSPAGALELVWWAPRGAKFIFHPQ
jgi:hypothetical protein